MAAFDVWGWYSPTSDNGETTKVFEAKKVTNTGSSWKYGIPERWKQGNTYRFYAIYPSKEDNPPYKNTNCAESGSLTITDFDCSHTVDLMIANEVVECPTNSYPGKIQMKFQHELARVNFTVKSENTVATVSSFKVYGVNYKGTLTKKEQTATWDPVTACDEGNTPFTYTQEFTLSKDNWEKDIFGDVLLIPDDYLTDANLEIIYKYPDETTSRTSTVNLNTTISGWEAGKSYKYTLTIKRGSLSVNVTVNDWDGKDTSVSWE